jgi:alkylation response protein AidB-like acyl-CoA dehydrogenase
MMSCEKLVAFALTEPNDESDVLRFQTPARLGWRVLNGAKRSMG